MTHVTRDEIRDKLGFKFAHGEVLQLIGRIVEKPKDRFEFRTMRETSDSRLRVVGMGLEVCPEGCVQRTYVVRSFGRGGHFTHKNTTQNGCFQFVETELEPFVETPEPDTNEPQ